MTVMEGYSLIVYGSVVPLLLTDTQLALTPATAGMLGSLIYAGMLVGAFSAGVISDRVGRQPALLAAIILFGAGFLATGLAISPTMLGLARILSGLGVGGAVTTALALARNHAPSGRASLVVNITMAGIPVGGAVASLVGIGVMPAYGWRPMFLIGAVLTLVILIVVALVRLEGRSLAQTPADDTPSQSSVRELFRGRGALLAALLVAVAIPNMFTWFGLNVWLTAAMTALHYPLTSALLFGFTLTAGAVVGSLVISPLADRRGPVVGGIVTASFTVLGLVGIVAGIRFMPLLLLCVALLGAGGHTTMNLLNAAASNLFPAAIRGTAMGWTNSMSYLGAFGPLLGGLIIESSLGPYGVFVLFGCSACLAVLMLAVFAAVTRRPTTTGVAHV
ncbi:MFS transporter [Saccharopolyspora phatthalungensis]|uniref:AAHS family benzoate transporter-like MFS transporter n=1 Tax=Saccharopolyspora phatthalungensis TaxID=664693 RepID=A0A840QES9_9PSEU|nr:AAHS family benzoate transporter-like MFS transporter [Saccharopolyspora phatthalungensis]